MTTPLILGRPVTIKVVPARTVCAWCGAVRKVVTVPSTHFENGPDYVVAWERAPQRAPAVGELVSHGMCPACAAKADAQLESLA